MSQIIVECPIWKAILADERLAAARRKLSFHEIRLIIGHALASADTRRMAETGNTDSVRSTGGAVVSQPREDAVERVARATNPRRWALIDEARKTAEFYRSKIGQVGYREPNTERHMEFHQKRADEMAEEQLNFARAAIQASPDVGLRRALEEVWFALPDETKIAAIVSQALSNPVNPGDGK